MCKWRTYAFRVLHSTERKNELKIIKLRQGKQKSCHGVYEKKKIGKNEKQKKKYHILLETLKFYLVTREPIKMKQI